MKEIAERLLAAVVLVAIMLLIMITISWTSYFIGRGFTSGVIDQLEKHPLNIKQTHTTQEN